MSHKHWHGCGRRGRFEFNIPDAMMAMSGARRGRGWSGHWGPIDFDFGDGPPGGGRGRRGGRRRMFGSGELRLVLLKLIGDEPRHGYDLIRAVEELTFGDYAPSPGVIYPTLTLLQDMGLIEEAKSDGPRKPFQATEEGRKHLAEKADEVEALFERLAEEFAPHLRSGGAKPIGRAVGNLMNALSHRIGRDGIDDELLHEIATILDEAAQRIERVK